MAVARIENGAVVEERPLALDDIPEHKRSLWRPVVIEGEGPSETVVIEADKVRRVRAWTPGDQAALVVRRIGEAWAECQRRQEGGAVSVTTSAGTHDYGTDRITQDNISKVMVGVLAGVVPNPRPWTPKNGLVPVSLSHDDLKLVGATVMARVDATVQAYLGHKAYLANPARTLAEIQSYDLSQGWPV